MVRPVVVLGSGAAGLAAALAAARGGADVVVLERDALLGGTTAISGGVVWAPANPWQRAAGIDDSPDAALAYLRHLATGDVDDTLMATFVTDAARVMAELEAATPLRWEALVGWPDYHEELPGGLGGGRSLWPRPLALAPDLAARVRRPPELGDGAADPVDDGVVFRGPVRGHALVGGLAAGALDHGVELQTGRRATRLLMEDGAVVGVEAGGAEYRGSVILATGGFQHDARLAASFLPVPGVAPLGTPGCAGDGLRLALAAGADLGNMAEGWWMPAIHVPGEELDGAPWYRPLHSERAQPGSIMVDRSGRRFVDEAQNYGDVGRAMHRFDAASHSYPAAPCWLVFDGAYRSRYPVGPLQPGEPDPSWLVCRPTIAKLGEVVGEHLDATVEAFNRGAARGEDPAHGRGALPYDRWIAGGGPTLAPLVRPPFYAAAVVPGCMGTKGGARTDDRGRVLRASGEAVPGLYAAGNAAASPFGTATAAGGSTLGPALVFGTRAGEAASGDGDRRG
ncbi:MAG TPA: FAD-dependent oxidoreductase [Acidimicrobiales bacterium]